MRLIDADALKADYIRTTTITNTPCCLYVSKEQIDNAPTIEAEPIRHGEWVWDEAYEMFTCSECGKQMIRNDYPYCAFCGAKMEADT